MADNNIKYAIQEIKEGKLSHENFDYFEEDIFQRKGVVEKRVWDIYSKPKDVPMFFSKTLWNVLKN